MQTTVPYASLILIAETMQKAERKEKVGGMGMKTRGKRVLSMLLTLCMVVGMMPAMSVDVEAASFFDINQSDVFLKQPWGSGKCTLYSNIMLFRRGAIINGDTNWRTINEATCAFWWTEGSGYNSGMTMQPHLWGMTAGYTPVRYVGCPENYSVSEKKAFWKNSLTNHPEGIVAYYASDNPSNSHAVLLLDYSKDEEAFICADPSPNVGKGRIKLELCAIFTSLQNDNIPQNGMSKEDYIISNINCLYWMTGGINYANYSMCNAHTYDKYGVCTNCGAKADFSQYTGNKTVTLAERGTFAPGYTAMSGQYMPSGNNEVTIWQAPFDKSGAVGKLAPKQPVTVTGRFWNGVGTKANHIWYTVDYGGEERYMYSSYLTPYVEPPAESTLKVSLSPRSLTIDPNGSEGILGSISSNYKITQYYASINNSPQSFFSMKAGDYGIGIQFTTDCELNKALRSTLKNADFVNKVNTVTVTARDSKGTMRSDTIQFTLKENTLKQPEISYVRSDYGVKYYRISNPNDSGTLSWSHSGKTGNDPATIAVTSDATISATVSKSGYKSASNSLTVSSSRSAAPGISIMQGSEGASVMLSHSNNAAKLYYRVNGGSASLYNRNMPIMLSESATISAWAEEKGYWTSAEVSKTYTATAPSKPTVKLTTASFDIAQGKSFAVSWNRDSLASSYDVRTYLNGSLLRTENVSGVIAYTVKAEESGRYTVDVTAKNRFGSSSASNEVAVTSHAPVTVTFQMDNGTMIEEPKTVDYGSDIMPPSVPTRKGHTFIGWSRGFTNITSDVTITANYQINTYTVTFYNVDGESLLGTQRVQYDQPIDSATMEERLDLGGYSFGGWHISKSDADSRQDLEHVDCNMNLVATKVWNEVGKIKVTIDSAARNEANTGYNVRVTLDAQDAADLGSIAKKVKVITTLKTADDQTLAAEITTLNVQAGDLKEARTEDIFVSYDGNSLAENVEVTVVGVDENDHTGGALSALVSRKPEITVVYSPWMTAEELAAKGVSPSDQGVQSKIQYKSTEYRRETTTRTVSTKSAPSVSGYDLVSSTPAESWTAWSGWSDTKYTESNTREVNTKSVKVSDAYTQYRYGRWSDGTNNSYCPYAGSSNEYYGWGTPYSRWKAEYTAWTTQRYVATDTIYACYESTHDKHITNLKGPTGWDNFRVYLPQGAGYSYATRWFWEESQTVAAKNKTQYQYRDKRFTYTYERWVVSVSKDWDDAAVFAYTQADSKCAVETRPIYRYITNDISVADLPSTADIQEITGALNWTDDNMVSKVATVLVYKETNSDPTEPQLEYVKQIELGEGNTFSFTFIPKENPNASTGDFIVALALEGASNVVNVGKIFAPREYTVTFCDSDGNVISTQEHIPAGDSAEMVQAPELPGYSFVCWNKDFSSVLEDLEVSPVYWPNQYSAVFVDYENGTATLRTNYAYHDLLLTPDQPIAEGVSFAGWEILSNTTGEVVGNIAAQSVKPEGEASLNDGSTDVMADFLVEDDLIAIAKWTPSQYTVKFMDVDGSELDSQQVDFGSAAELPAIETVAAGMEFLGWSTDSAWWRVTENMIVYPIIRCVETTEAPVSSLGSFCSGVYEKLELKGSDDSTIYYTVDGSSPDPDKVIAEGAGDNGANSVTYVFDGAIELDKTTYIRAMSRSSGKNDSEVVDIMFVYDDSNEGDISEDSLVELGTYNLMVKPGQTTTLSFTIDDNPGLAAYELVINADPAVFGIVYDEDTIEPLISEGEVCAGKGNVLLGNYQEGIGWPILWFGSSVAEGNGTLCSVQIKADDDIEAGVYPVTISYSAANTISEEFLEQDLEGRIAINTAGALGLLGDINGDGVISSLDVVRVARYLIHDIELTDDQLAAADVTGDGKVTASDVIRLARYLVGLAELLVP